MIGRGHGYGWSREIELHIYRTVSRVRAWYMAMGGRMDPYAILSNREAHVILDAMWTERERVLVRAGRINDGNYYLRHYYNNIGFWEI